MSLSRRVAPVDRLVRLAIALATATMVLCAYAADSPPMTQRLDHARFSLGTRDDGVAGGEERDVTLPHAWSVTNPRARGGDAWYVLRWPLPQAPVTTQAVYLSAVTIPAEVYVNGEQIGGTGPLDARRPYGYEQSDLFPIPAYLAHGGDNTIALHVRAPSPDVAGLGPVLVGDTASLRQRAVRDLVAHTLGPAAVAVATLSMGLFITALWLRRRDPAYMLFGSAAILWSIHTIVSLVPQSWLPPSLWRILWHAVYVVFVALLCLFCLTFAGVRWKTYRRIVIGYAAVVFPILYLANTAGILRPVATLVRLGCLMLVLFALVAVTRFAWRHRNVESLLMVVACGISVAFALHDWIAARDPLMIRPVWLVPYAALGFLTLLGYMLVNRFIRALDRSEQLNIELERRVQQKSAALSDQLAQTKAAKEAAEAASLAKTRFLAAASHDLRQPLHALGMFSQALSEHTQDVEGHALAQRIKTSVDALEALFSALLDVSKLDAGVVTPRPADVPLRPLLDRLGDDFIPEALERGLKLAVVSPDVVVRSDPVLLERILRNLLANALRYTARGGVVIGCRPRGGGYSIEVWDSGPGIAPAEQARIFEEFYQMANPGRDRSRGLGLGLAIVRRLADLLGHRIEVASQLGRGSTFRVIVAAGRPGGTGDGLLPTGSAASLAGRRIVVLDDERDVRDATIKLLAQWGCDAVAVATVEEARRTIASGKRPDVMIVDYRLADGGDGIQAIFALEREFGLSSRAVVVSGESSAEQLARIHASGLLLLHKPVSPARLRSVLSHLLGLHRDAETVG